MKNLFLFLFLFFCVLNGYSQQYPINQTIGATTTLVTSRGGFKADSSFILPAYSDTNKANANPYVKNYAGSLIKVGNTLYVRSTDLSKWILVGSGSGATPTLQQVTTAGATTTNTISVAGLNLVTGANSINLANSSGNFIVTNTGTSDEILNVTNGVNGYLKFGGGTGQYVQINSTANGNVELTAPSTSGIIPISVNGITADAAGNITVAGGTGTVTSISQGYGITNSPNPITTTGTIKIDTATLSNKYLRLTDTSAMLSSYNTRINGKLNISDTANMLTNYFNKVNYGLSKSGQTISVDTSTLSGKYLRIVDTSGKWVNNITRTAGVDSIIFFKDGTRYAIKDSVGGSSRNGRFGNDTATVVMAKVHNNSGVVLTNGKVVAWSTSGTNSDAPSVRLANNKGDSTSANTVGFVSGTIAINDTGWVILSGKIEKLNTAAFSNGDIIYLDSISGEWTKTKPSAPYHLVYLGVIVKANAGNGSIFVKCQNGYELDEIHDVKITSPVNNQVLAYSDTQRLWKNRNIYSIVDTTNTIATKSNLALKLNISDTSAMLSKYLRKIDTTSLSNRINLKLNISDTASMLNPYLRKIDTASLSNRIDNEVSNLDILQSLSFGIKAEPYGITYANVTSQLALTSPRLYFYPFNWNISDSIRGIAFLNRAATTLTSTNYNGVAIYSLSSGTLTRLTFTPNNGTFWDNASINTWKTQAITPYYLPKGVYYLGYQVSGSAGTPTIASGTIMQSGLIEPPSAVNSNGIKISSFISNATTSPPSSVAFSTTTTLQQVPYFILY